MGVGRVTFAVGQRVMTATSDVFVENRRGEIADVLGDDLYVLNDKGLRIVLHASELVPVPDDDDAHGALEIIRLCLEDKLHWEGVGPRPWWEAFDVLDRLVHGDKP